MLNHQLLLPEDFLDFEYEVQSKGCFDGAILVFHGCQYRISFYDDHRINQEISDKLNVGQPFFERNLVVIPLVTRLEMEKAAKRLVELDLVNSLVRE